MDIARRILLVAVAFASLTTGALAGPSVVGSWKGHLIMDTTKMPKAPNAQAQAQMDQGMAKLKKTVISITFKGNKTFSATTSGMPGQDKPQNGTWTQSGNTVTLTGTNKGPDGKAHPQTFTLSKDGKTLSTAVSGGAVKIVLARA